MSLRELKNSIGQGVTSKQQAALNRLPSNKYERVHGSGDQQPVPKAIEKRLKLDEIIKNLRRKGELPLPASTTLVSPEKLKVLGETTINHPPGQRPIVFFKGEEKDTHIVMTEALLPDNKKMVVTLRNRETGEITHRTMPN